MHDADGTGCFPHAGDEPYQPLLVGVGGIAAQAIDACLDGVGFPVQGYSAALPFPLYLSPRCAFALVAHEQHIMPGIVQHRLQVVDDAATSAHATARDHHGGAGAVRQVADHSQVGVVVVHREQLFEAQGLAALGDPLERFLLPVGPQFPVGLGEAAGQRGVQNHRQFLPGQRFVHSALWVAVEDILQLVQQFLGAADAEGRDQDGALILQGAGQYPLQPLLTFLSVFVVAIPVGAFDHQGVAAVGWLGCRQHGGVRCAQVPGEHHPVPARRPFYVAFHVGGAEDVPCSSQPYSYLAVAGVQGGVPLVVGQRHQAPFDHPQVTVDVVWPAAEAQFEGVLEDDGQQLRRGLAAEDRAFEARRQQPGYSAHVVYVHVGDYQGLDRGHREIDGQVIGVGAAGALVAALEQAAVHQQAVLVVQTQFVGGSGDAVDGAVVADYRPGGLWLMHCVSPLPWCCLFYVFLSVLPVGENGFASRAGSYSGGVEGA